MEYAALATFTCLWTNIHQKELKEERLDLAYGFKACDRLPLGSEQNIVGGSL